MEEHTQSFRDAAQTGRSDGSVSGNRGQQEHYRRNAAVAHEANKLGETIWKGIFALFVHPVFSFIGFWILGLILMILLGPVIGATESADGDPGAYLWIAGGVPIVLALLLRKYVRKVMIGVLITLVVFLTVKMIMEVKGIRANRAGQTPSVVTAPLAGNAPAATAPAATAPAVTPAAKRVLTPEEVQRYLDDARAREQTATRPAGSVGSEFRQIYCSGPPAERPAGLCP